MAADSFDHLILGSTPVAGLVAGLLAIEHGKRVCLVGEPFSPFRLRRHFGLSISPVTRPETLILIKRAATETGKLVNSIGKGLMTRVDPLFVAETPESVAALSHFRHLAYTLGYAVEPVADRSLADGLMVRVRDAQLLGHGRLEPALEAWLKKHEVRHLDAAETDITLRKDGTARIVHDGRTVEAQQAVLVGDRAILHYLDAGSLDRSIETIPGTSFLLEGGKPLPSAFINFIDRGVMLEQDGKVSMSALVSGDPATTRARLGSAAARSGALRIAGETGHPTLHTVDGAPYFGPGRGTKALIVAGLGASAPFLAPVIARQLAGKSAADEADWFAARGPTRGNQRLQVSDYSAVPA